MWEIEGFDSIVSSVTLAKQLYDLGRYDVMGRLCDTLCWDSYFENLFGVIGSVFKDFQCDYDDNEETEFMTFGDDAISDYFVHAWEYGELHKLHYSQNPLVTHARDEIHKCFSGSCSVDSKLCAYIRTKKSAQKSKLIVLLYNGCGSCSTHETVANGIIRLYTWLKNKCAEFEALKTIPSIPNEVVPAICAKSKHQEAIAA